MYSFYSDSIWQHTSRTKKSACISSSKLPSDKEKNLYRIAVPSNTVFKYVTCVNSALLCNTENSERDTIFTVKQNANTKIMIIDDKYI